jgi:hypothetical protein
MNTHNGIDWEIVGGALALLFYPFLLVVKLIGYYTSRSRDAKLRESGLLPATGQATLADVERLIRAGQRTTAIRCYREIYHCGLAEAKKAIDDLHIAA